MGLIARWRCWLGWGRAWRRGADWSLVRQQNFGHHLALGGYRVFVVPVEHPGGRAARVAAPIEALDERHIVQTRRQVLEDDDIQALLRVGAAPEQVWIGVGSHHFPDRGQGGERSPRLGERDDELGRGFARPLDLPLPGSGGQGTSREHCGEHCERIRLVHRILPKAHPVTALLAPMTGAYSLNSFVSIPVFL